MKRASVSCLHRILDARRVKMKVVLCLAVTLLALVAGERKAPYLPSGWKPEGPAFLLPSEVQKPADNPLKSTVEVEASGSDFLREYGPPALSQQGLPDAVTEQSFNSIKTAAVDVKAVSVEDNGEALETNGANVENNRAGVENNSDNVENSGAVVENNGANVENSGANLNNAEKAVNGDEGVEIAVEGRRSEKQEDESANEIANEHQVQNVQGALSNLGQESSSQQVKSSSEEKTIQQEAGVPADTPAGFLEYGPPKTLEPAGLSEYGPPQEYGGPPLRAALVAGDASTVQPVTAGADILNSETRRRRFSPRLRPVRRIQ